MRQGLPPFYLVDTYLPSAICWPPHSRVSPCTTIKYLVPSNSPLPPGCVSSLHCIVHSRFYLWRLGGVSPLALFSLPRLFWFFLWSCIYMWILGPTSPWLRKQEEDGVYTDYIDQFGKSYLPNDMGFNLGARALCPSFQLSLFIYFQQSISYNFWSIRFTFILLSSS